MNSRYWDTGTTLLTEPRCEQKLSTVIQGRHFRDCAAGNPVLSAGPRRIEYFVIACFFQLLSRSVPYRAWGSRHRMSSGYDSLEDTRFFVAARTNAAWIAGSSPAMTDSREVKESSECRAL